MLSSPPLASLFARAQELRGPFTLSEGSSSFEQLREAVEQKLAMQLRTVDNAFVQRAHMLHSQQRMHAVCAAEIATSIEAAAQDPDSINKIRQDVPSLVRSLSELQGALVGDLVELVLGCAQSAEERSAAQAERIARAEGETSEVRARRPRSSSAVATTHARAPEVCRQRRCSLPLLLAVRSLMRYSRAPRAAARGCRAA